MQFAWNIIKYNIPNSYMKLIHTTFSQLLYQCYLWLTQNLFRDIDSARTQTMLCLIFPFVKKLVWSQKQTTVFFLAIFKLTYPFIMTNIVNYSDVIKNEKDQHQTYKIL